jgi:hypothetical protein
MLGMSEQEEAQSHRSLKLIRQRMRKSGVSDMGVIHPNHPILMRSEKEWEQEELGAKEKREKGKRKAREEEGGGEVKEKEKEEQEGAEEGPAKKRRRMQADDGDDGGESGAMAIERSEAEQMPQLARGYKPGDSIVL